MISQHIVQHGDKLSALLLDDVGIDSFRAMVEARTQCFAAIVTLVVRAPAVSELDPAFAKIARPA